MGIYVEKKALTVLQAVYDGTGPCSEAEPVLLQWAKREFCWGAGAVKPDQMWNLVTCGKSVRISVFEQATD